ncbi:MAG: methyltransferase family protein, partial [Vicinamibacterales bacterium]
AALAPHLPRLGGRRPALRPAEGLVPSRIDGPPDTSNIERRALPRIDPADALGRVIIIVLFSFLAFRMGMNFLETGHVTGLLLLASELTVVVLTLFRRAAVRVDRSWEARLLTGASLAGPPLLRPLTSAGLVADAVTAGVSAVGLLIVVAGKLSLGRSFGLMPAHRGIVCAGLYRAVRHPIYAGYVLTHAAFLVANPSLWNVSVIALADAALLARAVREERTLAEDPEYRTYLDRVRWRVLPGVF